MAALPPSSSAGGGGSRAASGAPSRVAGAVSRGRRCRHCRDGGARQAGAPGALSGGQSFLAGAGGRAQAVPGRPCSSTQDRQRRPAWGPANHILGGEPYGTAREAPCYCFWLFLHCFCTVGGRCRNSQKCKKAAKNSSGGAAFAASCPAPLGPLRALCKSSEGCQRNPLETLDEQRRHAWGPALPISPQRGARETP